MSRPPGLPERPPGLSPPSGNSYRPPPTNSYRSQPRPRSPPRDQNFAPRTRHDDMYQFQGNLPRYDDVRPPPYAGDSYRPSDYPGDYSRGDSYRPEPQPQPRFQFSFRREPPPSIDFDRPHYSQPSDHQRQDRRHDRSGRNDRYRNGRYGRGGYVPVKTAERPFLRTKRDPTPELMEGMDGLDTDQIKFRALDELSDSEEAEMDVSEDDLDGEDSEEPKKKQAKTDEDKPDANEVPKWSNPDPYTALPPPDESLRKKKDVVKLIRKARVTTAPDDNPKPDFVADDFISFDFGDDAKEDDAGIDNNEDGVGVPGAPTGPRGYSHRDTIQGKTDKKSENDFPAPIVDTSSDPALGNRKRTHDDEIKGPLPPKKVSMKPSNGEVLEDWEPVRDTNPTPWCTVDHCKTESMGFWLHKEIIDFYNHVQPRDFEDTIRSNLVRTLQTAVQGHFPGASVYPFGSFPAGLYLPTADMDLVFCSEEYLTRGRPIYNTRKIIFRFKAFVENKRLAVPDSVEMILGAKVPLVKYVDRETGLKVDVSFENDTGLIANNTFQEWKKMFPSMPILVTLVKHFLAMRGLNEPVNGGIGGFSVICLVISMLQLMPQVQSYNMVPEHHLGEILMEFLDLYGHEFDFKTTAIQFDPPGYVSKTRVDQIIYRSYDRLSIIDPNNPRNDISGGSSNIGTVFRAFSYAFKELQARMAELSRMSVDERRGASILEVILGGNYESFDLQRQHLWNLHQEKFAGPPPPPAGVPALR